MKPMQHLVTKAMFGITVVIFSLSMLLYVSAIAVGQGKLAGIAGVFTFVWVVTGIAWLLCWSNEVDPRPRDQRNELFRNW
jgi:hypothetical protein